MSLEASDQPLLIRSAISLVKIRKCRNGILSRGSEKTDFPEKKVEAYNLLSNSLYDVTGIFFLGPEAFICCRGGGGHN